MLWKSGCLLLGPAWWWITLVVQFLGWFARVMTLNLLWDYSVPILYYFILYLHFVLYQAGPQTTFTPFMFNANIYWIVINPNGQYVEDIHKMDDSKCFDVAYSICWCHMWCILVFHRPCTCHISSSWTICRLVCSATLKTT